MSLTTRKVQTETVSNEEVLALRREIAELTAESWALRQQLEGSLPSATAWLQSKVWRQRRVLDARNRKAAGQRFVLRTLEQLGRGLTKAEYDAARTAVQDEQLRTRIPEYEVE